MTNPPPVPTLASYDLLASEYYDAALHPTCANFRDGSRQAIETLLPAAAPAASCEVGAGDSLLAAIYHGRELDLSGMLITDCSAAMLEYSRRFVDDSARLVLAEASRLPVADETLALVVASLGDPFDKPDFWAEVARVLTETGTCVMTVPSWEWASTFRLPPEPRDAARFDLADRRVVYVESHIRPPAAQRELITSHGLSVVRTCAIPVDRLTLPLSPKLSHLPGSASVVVGYAVQRR
jgi:SAM-dependent methyltransferase